MEDTKGVSMGMDQLLSSLKSEAEKERKEKLEAAQEEARRLISEAKRKKEKSIEEGRAEAQQRIEEYKRERLAWARLEAKRIISDAKEDAVNLALEDTYEEIEKASKELDKYIKAKISEAVKELSYGKGKVVIHLRKGKKKLAQGLKNVKVVEDLKEPGALLESPDGKVVINLTLPQLFELKKEKLRRELYKLLFSAKVKGEGGKK